MTSETQIRYGSLLFRQGRSRVARRYKSSSRRRTAAGEFKSARVRHRDGRRVGGALPGFGIAVDALDVVADPAQLLVDSVVPAVEMVHALDEGLVLRGEARHHEAGRRAEVGGH